MRAMIYLRHFIGRSWILSLCRKPLFTIKEAWLQTSLMHCICEAKGPDHVSENRNTKFNLLCPVCIVPNGKKKSELVLWDDGLGAEWVTWLRGSTKGEFWNKNTPTWTNTNVFRLNLTAKAPFHFQLNMHRLHYTFIVTASHSGNCLTWSLFT